ncbi:glyoxalase [Bradyrhizobium sp. CCBAU 11434]|uniref:VOC family protein n=1 Tax=Bradyrhizobium sp. CCBAU 11434 TaxID=1630885 RepID=UPI0023069D96|nr:VOC family protein [Bradyrhizobium sp. CCBAU 11434]MDA9525636.1 glyoxalase [Bradyrhizobium sp. CCBAU 11434]
MKAQTLLRIARPTNDLDAVIAFYKVGLGLSELYRFEQHEGFDGVMLGRPGESYHLEFTRAHGHDAGRAPSKENLLVFYFPLRSEWEAAVSRMQNRGYCPVQPFNPFWETHGVTFEDCDGYRVVLQNSNWPDE